MSDHPQEHSEPKNHNSSYAVLPCFVMEDENLDEGAKILYARISMYSQEGRCWASNAHFAVKQKVDIRTIQRWLRQLVDNSYIEIELMKGGFQTKRNIWILVDFKKNFTKRHTCHVETTSMSPPPDADVIQTMSKQDKEDIYKGNVSKTKTLPRSIDQKKTLDAKRRWKLTDHQFENLQWLEDQGVNSDEATLAHWVKTYSFERLYEVVNHAKSKNPKNLGGYMQKLFMTDSIIENSTIKANSDFASDFSKAHGWWQLKILGKYCTFELNYQKVEIPLSLNSSDFINTLIEKHNIFTGIQ